MGKPVGSRFGQILSKLKTGKFRPGIAFTICTNQFYYRKTAANWYQRRLWRNGSRIFVWNSPTGKTGARSIQPKFPEISVQNSMDRFGPTGKVSKKRVHLLRWSSFPGRTGWNFGWMDRAPGLPFYMLRCSWNFSTETTRKVMYHLLFNRIFRKLFVSGKPLSCILECW